MKPFKIKDINNLSQTHQKNSDVEFNINENEEFETITEKEKMSDMFATTRRIYLSGEINEISIEDIIEKIHVLEQISKEDIYLYINSDGGYVSDAFALVDIMNASECDVNTIIVGRAASAACLIASNGSPGKRFAGTNAEFMYHQLYTDITEAKHSDLPYYEKEIKRMQTKMNKVFAKNTGRNDQEIKKMFFRTHLDQWMNANGAKKFGIVDHFLRNKRKLIPEKNKIKINKKD